MTPEDLQKRTKAFAIRIMKLAAILEKHPLGKFVGRQIFRSGTSEAANYRAACKAKSAKDFIAKLGIVIEEADETVFWLEMIDESGIIKSNLIAGLLNEGKELTAIMVSSKNSAIRNQRSKK